MEFYKAFPTSGTVYSESRIADVLDKGKGAALLVEVMTYDSEGDKICMGQYTIFLRGAGNFGGKRSSPAEKATRSVPNRKPDTVVEQKTSENQAAYYRLASGDYNPLHIDPSFAAMGGFKQPILHGLCSFGFSARHVIESFGGGDGANLKEIKARFAKPVIPGQTLITEQWREGNTIHFQTRVKETGEIAISGGYAILKSVTVAAQAASSTGVKQTKMTADKELLKSAAVFEELGKRLTSQPELVKKVNAIFLWIITKDGKEVAKYTVDLASGKGSIYEGEPKAGKPGVTLTLDDANMEGLVTGKLNPQQAFMSGKLKIKGNIMLTQKLQTLLKDQAKL
jgi:3-hydroxyacyl-CoA dehydrogenase/3a,7a,12a-trihydroxy-5b-cholest-24-enoyl-CoA hydratase